MATQASKATFTGFAKRWTFALILVAATYNSTEHNFVYWLFSDIPDPVKLLIGAAMIIGYYIYLRATLVSIGLIGILFLAIVFGGFYWLIAENLAELAASSDFFLSFVIVAVATIMSVGLYWSFIRRKLSGQNDVV